ncbi:hypothetical protein AAHE18_12G076100 [Arachis hypogaea]
MPIARNIIVMLIIAVIICSAIIVESHGIITPEKYWTPSYYTASKKSCFIGCRRSYARNRVMRRDCIKKCFV